MIQHEKQNEVMEVNSEDLSLQNISNKKDFEVKENSEKKLQSIQCYCIFFYFGIIMLSVCLFTFNKTLNKFFMDFFLHIDDNMTLNQFFLLAAFITFLVVIGFPTTPWELAFGYFFNNYILAFLMDICCKLSGFVIIFCIAKTLLKKRIDDLLRDNKYFRIIKLGVNTHPYKTVFLIKVMMIPHLIKNYGLGITDINFIQYLLPSVIVASIFGAGWIYLGRQLASFSHVFDPHTDPGHQITFFKIALFAITCISIIIILCYAKKLYKDLEKEIEKEDSARPSEVKDYGSCIRSSENS